MAQLFVTQHTVWQWSAPNSMQSPPLCQASPICKVGLLQALTTFTAQLHTLADMPSGTDLPLGAHVASVQPLQSRLRALPEAAIHL